MPDLILMSLFCFWGFHFAVLQLMINRKEWIESVLPARLTFKEYHIKNKGYTRINWVERDKELSKRIKAFIEKSLAENIQKRLSAKFIAINIGFTNLRNNFDKLPLCKQTILSFAESSEDYQKRRIDWTIKQFLLEGKKISFWGVVERLRLNATIYSNTNLYTYLKRIIYENNS